MKIPLIDGKEIYHDDFDLDLGDGHYFSWSYQTAENPIRVDSPRDDRGPIGGIMVHRLDSSPTGYCTGGVTFDVPYLNPGFKIRGNNPAPLWQVQSLDPLTISPSLLCHCGDHGFIREGRWVRA